MSLPEVSLHTSAEVSLEKFRESLSVAFDKLDKEGYCVIDDVMNTEKCNKIRNGIHAYMKEVGVDFDDPTLKKADYPNQQGIIQHLGIGQCQAVWDAREDERVALVFEMLYGTNDLIVSFDGVCVQPVWMRDTVRKMHTDQSHKKLGRRCIQGFVNLTPALDEGTGTLMVIPGGHKKHSDFAKNHPDLVAPQKVDWFEYEESHWNELGGNPIRVFCKAGSLVLFDSRTPHRGAPPSKNQSSTVVFNERNVVYICMQPRSYLEYEERDGTTKRSEKIKEKNEKKKKAAFLERRMTSHWPTAIKMFPKTWQTYGKIQSRLKQMPPDDRKRSARQLELAGITKLTTRPLRKGKPVLKFEF